MKSEDIDILLEELLKLPKENEWVEFNFNHHLFKSQVNLAPYPSNFANMKIVCTFANNNTCHASRQISAPGQVFAFYGLGILCNPLNPGL